MKQAILKRTKTSYQTNYVETRFRIPKRSQETNTNSQYNRKQGGKRNVSHDQQTLFAFPFKNDVFESPSIESPLL